MNSSAPPKGHRNTALQSSARRPTLRDVLPYLYLLRVPWISLSFVIALVVAARFSSLQSILEGAFDLTRYQIFWVTFAACLCGVTIAVAASLVLEYGPLRFANRPPLKEKPVRLRRYIWLSCACVLLTVIPILLLVKRTNSFSTATLVLWSLLGLLPFFAVVAIAYLGWKIPGDPFLKWLTSLLSWSPEGYLDSSRNGLLPGHAFALAWAFVFLVFHSLVGIGSFWFGQIRNVPTLIFVLGMISVTCWFFSGMAFFFDRFRIPVLVPFFLIVGFAGLWQDSDHFFSVQEGQIQSISPVEILDPTISPTPILIATSGGGIHAEAWTVQVLTALDARFPEFSRSIRLISAVSGGSVGAMQYVEGRYGEWWNQCSSANPKEKCFQELVRVSTESSLEYVGWGLVYPDVVRSLFPPLVPRRLDRGYGLETAWTEAWQRPNTLTGTMTDWMKDLRDLRKPALIFNSTLVETGDRVVFANFDFDDSGKPSPLGTTPPITFRKLFPNQKNNVPVRTAVRLSAAFPYASPVSRSEEDLPPRLRYHFADGGYYDNYGILSAVNFIDEGLRENKPDNKKILLIEIRDSKVEGGPRPAKGSQGWFQQLRAPVATLLHVRDTAQRNRNQTDVELLRQALSRLGVDLVSAIFEYPNADTPLSWHLTSDQKNQISADWKAEFVNGAGSEQVRIIEEFLDTKK
jgi:Patatin-like phospholipase